MFSRGFHRENTGINWDGFEFFHRSLNKGSVFLFKPATTPFNATVPDEMAVKLEGLVDSPPARVLSLC